MLISRVGFVEGTVVGMDQERVSASGLWEKTCSSIRARVPENVYMQWFAGIVPVRADDTRIVLGVSDDIYAKWLTENYSDILSDGLLDANGKELKFEIETGHSVSFPEEDVSAADESSSFVLESAHGFSTESETAPNCLPSYTFDNFIVGEENRYAYSAAITAVQAPGKFNPSIFTAARSWVKPT